MAQSGVILSNLCRARLNEAQLRGEFATEVHFLSARGHADELSLTRRESEDRSIGARANFTIHARWYPLLIILAPKW
jgi:hypothetical protein